MSVRAQVAVTDSGWADFLAARPHLAEINFWIPGGGPRAMRVAPGSPWLFKSRAPDSRLIGGGYFAGYTRLSLSAAWTTYGEGNGAGSEQEMRMAIGRYRAARTEPDPVIGCVLIQSPTFFPWGPVIGTDLFAGSIVARKGFDLQEYAGSAVEAAVQLLAATSGLPADWPTDSLWPTRGMPRLVVPRVGQRAFRALVAGAYGETCAITGSRIVPTLQAAHIRPVEQDGEHRVDNGLLLRADVHLMFDRGYVGVDPRRRTLHVSRKLRATYGNGGYFYDRQNLPITVPRRMDQRPAAEFLEWHMDTCFVR